jgi:hypothetical protein
MATGRYAADTSVSADRTRNEIERTLERYGASGFAYAWQGQRVMIAFEAHNRRIRFFLELPDLTTFERTPSGRQKRTAAQMKSAYDQVVRQRWRALLLLIKAKLEAVESGIVTFEEEFLAHTVLADGRTVAEWAGPQLHQLYGSNRMPPLLPGAVD